MRTDLGSYPPVQMSACCLTSLAKLISSSIFKFSFSLLQIWNLYLALLRIVLRWQKLVVEPRAFNLGARQLFMYPVPCLNVEENASNMRARFRQVSFTAQATDGWKESFCIVLLPKISAFLFAIIISHISTSWSFIRCGCRTFAMTTNFPETIKPQLNRPFKSEAHLIKSFLNF